MSRPPYELSAAARLDLLRLWNYLAEQASLKVADKVLADIDKGIRKVAKSPVLGHERPDLTDHDVLFFRVHSFLIVYRRGAKPLNVARIVHGARDLKNLLAD